jgi:hypothetical protein
VIIKEDLCAIEAFDEEKVKAIFEASYTKVFQMVAGGLVSADTIIDSITEQVHQRLHSMVTDACAELDW